VANDFILKQKAGVISEIVNKSKESSSVIIVDYRGLTVDELTELRKQLKEVDTDLKVYKNSLTKRAMDELKLDLGDSLLGPSAISFSKDTVSPAKILSMYAKKHDALKIKVGIIEGKVADLELINKLASIPSREGLLTMLASGMMAIVRDLSISLDLYSKQLGGDESLAKEELVQESDKKAIEVDEQSEEATEQEMVEELPNNDSKKEKKGEEE